MRLFLLFVSTTIIGCSTTKTEKHIFQELEKSESVIIYMSKYNLDSIPREVGKLKNAINLYITIDSSGGWTIYPPLSALEQQVFSPPFKTLPIEITQLRNLRNLGLVGLNLNELPTGFGNLQNLDTLNLSINKLIISNELDKLKKLKKLKYLGLYGNKVDTADINVLKNTIPDLTIGSSFE